MSVRRARADLSFGSSRNPLGESTSPQRQTTWLCHQLVKKCLIELVNEYASSPPHDAFSGFRSGNGVFRRKTLSCPHRTRCWIRLKIRESSTLSSSPKVFRQSHGFAIRERIKKEKCVFSVAVFAAILFASLPGLAPPAFCEASLFRGLPQKPIAAPAAPPDGERPAAAQWPCGSFVFVEEKADAPDPPSRRVNVRW